MNKINFKRLFLVFGLLILISGAFFYFYFIKNQNINNQKNINSQNNNTLENLNNEEKISNDIIVDFPKSNLKIKSPLTILGKARGYWFFEAVFNTELYDENNNLLGSDILKAKSDWMTENFVPFEGELIFKKPETQYGKLVFLSNNPSGIAEYQKVYTIPVEFDNLNYQKVLLYYYNSEKDKDKNGEIKCSSDGLVPILREIPISQTPIKDTINLLLKGKENLTQKEIEQGISTEYPLSGFSLKSANLKSDGTLILEFDDPYNKTSGGSCRSKILWMQIEQTAKEFKNVLKVEFEPKFLFQP